MKSFLIKRGLDVLAPTEAMAKKKQELADEAGYEWRGVGAERALICMKIREVLEKRLGALATNGMLHQRHSGQVTLVLTGDKGGNQGATKIGILMADLLHPNSPSNLTLVAYFVWDDNRSKG